MTYEILAIAKKAIVDGDLDVLHSIGVPMRYAGAIDAMTEDELNQCVSSQPIVRFRFNNDLLLAMLSEIGGDATVEQVADFMRQSIALCPAAPKEADAE